MWDAHGTHPFPKIKRFAITCVKPVWRENEHTRSEATIHPPPDDTPGSRKEHFVDFTVNCYSRKENGRLCGRNSRYFARNPRGRRSHGYCRIGWKRRLPRYPLPLLLRMRAPRPKMSISSLAAPAMRSMLLWTALYAFSHSPSPPLPLATPTPPLSSYSYSHSYSYYSSFSTPSPVPSFSRFFFSPFFLSFFSSFFSLSCHLFLTHKFFLFCMYVCMCVYMYVYVYISRPASLPSILLPPSLFFSFSLGLIIPFSSDSMFVDSMFFFPSPTLFYRQVNRNVT